MARAELEVGIHTPRAWRRLLVGVALVFALFQVAAGAAGSTRGEAGIAVGALVVLAVLVTERGLLGATVALRSLRPPRAAGLVTALVVGLGLLAVIPVAASLTGGALAWRPGWPLLLPGLFAQAGVAEELLFRGFLHGSVREGRTFWRAAPAAAAPFVAAHLFLFATLPWAVAAASVLLAAALSLPLARLYELGGRTIWAPALVHFVVQGAIKVVEVEGVPALPLLWIAASATVPFLAFAVRPGRAAWKA